MTVSNLYRYNTRRCPLCREDGYIVLSQEEADAMIGWRNKEVLIQDALPNRSRAEREQIKTGIHPACWEKAFGSEGEN